MFNVIRNRRRAKEGINLLLNILSQEVYRDRAKTFYLLTCYYRTNTFHFNTLKTDFQLIIKTYKPILIQGKNFNLLIDKINSKFKNAIEQCYAQFKSLSESLLSMQSVNGLVLEHKKKLPNYFETIKALFLFNKKESKLRNLHLSVANVYNRSLLHSFFCQ